MGYGFTARCLECGHKFSANLGGGFIARSFHCDRCGTEELVTAYGDEVEQPSPCSCGGTFSMDAGPRCPKCRSDQWEEFFDPDHPPILWD